MWLWLRLEPLSILTGAFFMFGLLSNLQNGKQIGDKC